MASREMMDEYGFESQERTAAAYAAGRYDAELVPVTCERIVYDKATGEQSTGRLPSQLMRVYVHRHWKALKAFAPLLRAARLLWVRISAI